MRAVVQRAKNSKVSVAGEVIAQTGSALVVLLGIRKGDLRADARALAQKVSSLRIFPGTDGRMKKPAADACGEALVVSQFTLYAKCSKTGRLSFDAAEEFEAARELYEAFILMLGDTGLRVSRGVFGVEMDVEVVNAGPVTILLDSEGTI